jgi:hypothetical protein
MFWSALFSARRTANSGSIRTEAIILGVYPADAGCRCGCAAGGEPASHAARALRRSVAPTPPLRACGAYHPGHLLPSLRQVLPPW